MDLIVKKSKKMNFLSMIQYINIFFQAETVDMGFGKLSPRALQQPGHLIRSPSAPPIPYFPHHDSDEDDDDTESEDDPFVRTIISQFNRDRVLDFGDDNPRRYSEGYALGKQVSLMATAFQPTHTSDKFI